MNYREKQKKDLTEKKLRKLSVYRKKWMDSEAEKLAPVLFWEESADQRIAELKDKKQLQPQPGEGLYMTGWIGAAGTLFLADWKKEKLCTRFPAAFVNTAGDKGVFDNYDSEEDIPMPDMYIEGGASWIIPVGEGGLMKSLYRLGKETGLGFRVQARQVPVRQITIEFCEFFLLHPWEMLTGNSYLFTAGHDSAVFRKLEEQGIAFKKIGVVTREKQKLICHGEEESNINRPEPDGILTLLLEETGI